MSTLIRWDEETNMMLLKGAPEKVLERISHVNAGSDKELVPYVDVKEKIEKVLLEAGSKGERILAFAYKKESRDVTECREEDLTLWGLAVIRDPVRKEVAKAIDECRNAGIAVKMVTGDNPLTAKAIAKELGWVGIVAKIIDVDDRTADIYSEQE